MSLWIWMVLAVVSAQEPVELSERGTGALSDEAFRFCHEEGVDYVEARPFCDLLDGLEEGECPGLRATCEGAETELSAVGCLEGAGLPSSLPGGAPTPTERSEMPEWTGCEAEPWDLSGALVLLKWVAAGFVAALILVVARLVWSGVSWARRREDRGLVRDVEQPEVDLADDDVPERPSEDLLAEARRALEAGHSNRAVLLARGASLRHLHDQRRIVLHRSRTDREYTRKLKGDVHLYQALKAILRAVERLKWGGSPIDIPAAKEVLNQAERIVATVAPLLMLALFSQQTLAADRFSPQGDAALFSVMEDVGIPVSWRLRGLSDLDGETAVLVLDLTGLTPSEEDWAAIRGWVEAGGVLVVGGRPIGFPELGTYAPPVPRQAARAARRVAALDLPSPVWPDGPDFVWVDGEALPWMSLGTSREVNAGRSKQLAVAVLRIGEGAVLSVPDPRLFWNGAMVHRDNVAFWQTVLDGGERLDLWTMRDGLVQFATWSGSSSDSPVDSLMQARLLPFILHLLVWWLLLVRYKGTAFGVLRDPPEEGRLAFGDHARALAAHWRRLGAGAHAWSRFAALWLQRIGARGIELAALRAGYSADGAQELVRSVQDAAQGGGQGGLDEVEELWNVTRHR